MPSSRPTHFDSNTLQSDILAGRIKIPQFQRQFVWERRRSAALLDSILKGYPLGTLILWKTQERLRAVRNIGNLALPTPPEGHFTYQVLDGQQRLTSLVAAMEGVKLREDFAEICVDLDADPATDEIVVYEKKDLVPPGHTVISFKELLKAGLATLPKAYPAEKHLERIQALRDQFNRYQFPAVELSDATLAIATEIFTRLNVGGRQLTMFEIMVAKTWDDSRGFDLLTEVERIDHELGTANYGGIDHQIYVQTVAALAKQVIRTRDILEMRRAEFIDLWPAALKALRAAVDFCRSDLRVPVRALLPSERVLIPLAYYFHLADHRNPSGIARDRLVDLFFRIGLSERYSGTTESRIAQDLRAVAEIHAGRQPVYDYGVSSSSESIRLNGNFRAGRSYVKTLLCILAAKKPLDFRTGGEVLLDNALLKQRNSKNYHHFFPRAYLSKIDANGTPDNHIANITLIGADLNKNAIRAKPPSEYLAKFSAHNQHLAEDLKSHLIDYSIAITDDYPRFFQARCRALAAELQTRLIPQARDIAETGPLPFPEEGAEEDDIEESAEIEA